MLEVGSNGTVAAGRMEQCLNSDFRSGGENFAIPEKFSLYHIFAMIAKICYHSESMHSKNFAVIAKFTVHSEIFCFCFLSKQLRFGFSPFYPCNNLCFGLFL